MVKLQVWGCNWLQNTQGPGAGRQNKTIALPFGNLEFVKTLNFVYYFKLKM